MINRVVNRLLPLFIFLFVRQESSFNLTIKFTQAFANLHTWKALQGFLPNSTCRMIIFIYT